MTLQQSSSQMRRTLFFTRLLAHCWFKMASTYLGENSNNTHQNCKCREIFRLEAKPLWWSFQRTSIQHTMLRFSSAIYFHPLAASIRMTAGACYMTMHLPMFQASHETTFKLTTSPLYPIPASHLISTPSSTSGLLYSGKPNAKVLPCFSSLKRRL